MLNKFSEINKKAWDFDTYNFWNKKYGSPASIAQKIKENPKEYIKKYLYYFDKISGNSIINVCGSNGLVALALELLGADVTIVDISEHGKRYAMECASSINVNLKYIVSDFMMYNTTNLFDIAFLYIGVVHFFSDIEMLFKKIYNCTKKGGIMVYSDFHPFLKIQYGKMNYFDSEPFMGEMPYAKYYESDDKEKYPQCIYREYSLSEIINSIIKSGFKILCFDEIPFKTESYPCEFIVKAVKE